MHGTCIKTNSITIFVTTPKISTTEKGKLGGTAACGSIALIKVMKTESP